MNEVYILLFLANGIEPDVLAVYETLESAKKGIMEYVDGGTLRVDENLMAAKDIYEVNDSLMNGRSKQDKIHNIRGRLVRRDVRK